MPAYAPDWAEANGEERLVGAARRHLIEIESSEAAPGDVLLFRWRGICRRSTRQFSRPAIA